MRSSSLLPCVVVFLVATTCPQAHAQRPESDREPPIVLVELFTSQGCSSCPPADRLLRDLVDDQSFDGRVVGLAFHVDYWNHLGWQDPFSSRTWSERQRRYVRVLGHDQAYTPQLVVGGQVDVVGSVERDVRSAIERAFGDPPGGRVAMEVTRERSALAIAIVAARGEETAGTPWLVQVAIVEDGLETPVASGENGGRSLRNDRVVRRLVDLGRLEEGTTELRIETKVPVDPSWSRQELGVVAFLQDERTLAIEGVSATPRPIDPGARENLRASEGS